MGNNTSESFTDYLKTLKILKCPKCKDSYDIYKKVPKMICNNQHNLCDQCLSQVKSKSCPECKEVMWANKKKNVILTYILEQTMNMKQNRSDKRNQQEFIEQKIEEVPEIRSTRLSESPSKRVIKLKMVKQQSTPNINLENYYEDKQFKKKYSVANIFRALRQEMQVQSKVKVKQQTIEDVLNKHVQQYSIVAFKQIIQKKKNPEEIVNLDLHLNKIPKIFQVLSKFSNIQRLNLNKNRIKKIENIQTLQSLTYLSISENQIEIIENIEQLINLKNLYLNKNRIQRIQALQALVHLEFLGLGSNLLEKIEGINHLLQLKWLNLERNYIQKVQGISSLKNLEIILLGNNQITIFQGFDQLQNLKEIHLQSNKITDLGKALSMKQLRKLKLQDNPGLKEDHSKDYLKLLQLIEAKSKGIQKPDEGCSIY